MNARYWTILSKKTNRFCGHAMALEDGRVRIYEGGWTTGYVITKEQARERFILKAQTSQEESDKLEDRRMYELHR